jgi:uncharacterized membrane protein
MTGFSFLHPLIAIGVLGVAAPVIIHFFFRRRARNFEFPPMRYVILSYKKVARKLLLQEYLLLITRCLLVAILAMALAGPLYSKIVSGIKRGERPLAVMFVLDTSLSMTRSRFGKSLVDIGKADVERWLEQLNDTDKAGVLDAVRLAGTGLVSDFEEIRKALDETGEAYAPARMNQALALSASLLSDQTAMDRLVVIFTDMQRTGWTSVIEAGADVPPVLVVDVSEGMEPDNLSVSDMSISWKSLAREEAAQIKAKVRNHGMEDARNTLLRVEFGDQVFSQVFADVEAGGEVEKTLVLTEVPGGPAALRLVASDGIAGDNVAYFHLKGGREVSALLVDGDPGTGYLESETYFLDHALNPRLYARSRVNPRTVTTSELNSVILDDYKVIVLANVGRIENGAVRRVSDFVKNGGGLLFTMGDKTGADYYNAAWGELLPRELRGVKMPYAGARGASEVRVMHLESPSSGEDAHPILSVFQDPAQGDLGLAGFRKYFLLQQEIDPSARVILRLTDGAPMMVEGSYGRGKVILFASTADRAWNDLCIHPTYLPMLQQTVQYLADALMYEDEGGMFAGSVLEVPVGSGVTGARVMAPDGEVSSCELVEEIGARRIRVVRTGLPGVYMIQFKRRGVDMSSRFDPKQADRTIALNIDPAESDLSRITPNEIKARVGSSEVQVISPDAQLDQESPTATETIPYARYMLWTLIGLAILERVLTRKG